MAPFVVDQGRSDRVAGRLFDTGLDYPAAVFDGSGTILGRTYTLDPSTLDRCLAVLDDEEGTVEGLYRRVSVTTLGGHTAWAYEYGGGLRLTPIESGDWNHR